jgi:hypothetical protein
MTPSLRLSLKQQMALPVCLPDVRHRSYSSLSVCLVPCALSSFSGQCWRWATHPSPPPTIPYSKPFRASQPSGCIYMLQYICIYTCCLCLCVCVCVCVNSVNRPQSRSRLIVCYCITGDTCHASWMMMFAKEGSEVSINQPCPEEYLSTGARGRVCNVKFKWGIDGNLSVIHKLFALCWQPVAIAAGVPRCL